MGIRWEVAGWVAGSYRFQATLYKYDGGHYVKQWTRVDDEEPLTLRVKDEDGFYVAEDIPEFSTVTAGVAVMGACGGIYWWMRKKRGNFKFP